MTLLSAVVLLSTGVGWATLRQLTAGLTTSDVLGPGAGAPTDGAVDILLVGMDSRTNAQGNPLPADVLTQLHAGDATGELNTDTLILVHIPTDPTQKAVALSLPRDSYVMIPGYGKHKINSAYARATTTAQQTLSGTGLGGSALDQQSRQAGRRELVATVQQLTGVTIDHYAEVNLAGFFEITDVVGGVPVCLTAPVQDSYSGADFPAGPQTVQGGAALAFVRQRHGLPRGDLDRIVRQQVFLAGLSHKLLSAGILTRPAMLGALLGAVKKYLVLDQGWDLLGFAQQAKSLTGGNVEFQTIPIGRANLLTPEDGEAVEVDPQQVKDFIHTSTSTDDAGQPPDPTTTTTATAVVDVRNATSVNGLAERVLSDLTAQGFARGKTETAARRVTSVVRYSGEDRHAADRVAAQLGGLFVQPDPAVPPGHVQVTVGTDYTGPQNAPGTTPLPSAAQRSAPVLPATPAAPPITADGVPCVN